MSYVRFSEADVYVFVSCAINDEPEKLECCGCRLQKRVWVDEPANRLFGGHFQSVEPIVQNRFDNTAGMVAHLREHVAAGHDIPDWLIPEIEADDALNFPVTA